MPPGFLGLSPAAVRERVERVASAALSLRVVVHVGHEVFGYCNVGVDLPPGRRAATATRALRQRLRDALEGDGVVLAESALAPRVAGDLRGSVRVREVAPLYADASHMLAPLRR